MQSTQVVREAGWLAQKKRRGCGGPGTVVKVLALHACDPIWVPVLIPEAPLPIQLPACGPGKQLRTAQGPGIRMGDPEEAPGSWLRIGIVSAVALTWGVNHRTEDLPLCLSAFPIKK